MNKKTSNRVLLLVGGFFAAIGTFLLLKAGNEIMVTCQAQDWESVPATLESVVKDKHTSHGKRGTSTSYCVKPVYSYTYGGKTYQGKEIHPAYAGSNSNTQHSLFNKLNKARQAHQKVFVWVNPEDPEEAYLANGLDWGSFLLISFSFTFMAIGYGLLIFFWRQLSGWHINSLNYLEHRMTLPKC